MPVKIDFIAMESRISTTQPNEAVSKIDYAQKR